MSDWDILINGSATSFIKASESVFLTSTNYFFYVLLLIFTVILIYIATRNESAVFMTAFIGSVLLIYYEKIPLVYNYIIYTIMALSLALYLYNTFWRKRY